MSLQGIETGEEPTPRLPRREVFMSLQGIETSKGLNPIFEKLVFMSLQGIETLGRESLKVGKRPFLCPYKGLKQREKEL